MPTPAIAPLALALLVMGAAPATPPPAAPLLWPLPADYGVTSSFGDLRNNHLHAGLDLSTRGSSGLPVRAVADGEVVRLKVEWRGYGNAVYIRHANGDESVYAHLQEFEGGALGIATRARAAQASENTRYPGNVEVLPRIPVRRGDVIGLAGESGVGMPHLHLEWRAKDGTTPTDPYRVGLPKSSSIPQVEIPAAFVNAAGELRLEARAGIPGKEFGVTGLDVAVDGKFYYGLDLRRLTFDDYLHPGAIYDLEESEARSSLVYSLDPIGAEIWPGQVRAGARPLAAGSHRVTVEARDSSGARGVWRGEVRVPKLPSSVAGGGESSLTSGSFRLELANGTLHPGTVVRLSHTGDRDAAIEPSGEPTRPGARLIWHPPAGTNLSQAGICRIARDGQPRWAGGQVADGEVSAVINRFGKYRVIEDLSPPVLSPPRQEQCSYGPCFKVDVSDDLSGFGPDSVIFTFRDGRELAAEIDPDRGWATTPATAAAGLAGLANVRACDKVQNAVTWPGN